MKRTVAVVAPLVAAAVLPPAAALAQTSPSPSPSAAACPDLRLSAPEEEGNAATRVGGEIALRATSPDPASTYRLEVTSPYTGPIRSGAGTVTDWRVRPGENTTVRVRSTVRGQYSCLSNSLRLYVEPAVSIAVERVGVRAYRFTGRVLPGRGQLVTVYRVAPDRPGAVITTQGSVGPDGTYDLGRSFTGEGTFEFFAGVSASRTNLAGRSTAVRATVR